jgi:hypothetical protein
VSELAFSGFLTGVLAVVASAIDCQVMAIILFFVAATSFATCFALEIRGRKTK